MQSSSATALITSSFVDQNLIALAPALAIMLGADVGTSLMVQLFSLDLSWLSPLLIGFGVLFLLSRKATRAGQIGPHRHRPGPDHPRAADHPAGGASRSPAPRA